MNKTKSCQKKNVEYVNIDAQLYMYVKNHHHHMNFFYFDFFQLIFSYVKTILVYNKRSPTYSYDS
jgi:hypothetical protein